MKKNSGAYVDGFVLVVPTKKLAAYKKMATWGGKLWRKHGALDYKECVGDDMHPDMQGMKCLTFPELAKTKKDETVVFSFIVFKSRAHRDAVNKKVMNDPLMQPPKKGSPPPMPFDMKKMAYGGFKVLVSS